ncbi:hypothetical protein [Chitinophaga arvensicola]|uniref:Uncharacterized protein n=1 Tax=Chitinophaga arvensicola TaxID=29529 RepID=A0A1I0RHK5_9BACT|nr:hypothetical protein [Chitinophaga arvensicola]SEW40369.1 hypothetical protein SAMN04488122_2850 [Chitinophaga arvensicola]
MRYITGLLTLLLLIMASPVQAQKVPPVIPGYYNASRMEVAEELCVFENNRFAYAASYGAVDQFVKGVWVQQHDTVYLSTDPVKDKYIITSLTDKKVPAGKLLLVFRFNYQHAPYLKFSFSPSPELTDPPATTQTNEGFEILAGEPASRHLYLLHTMYDSDFSAYTLADKVNKVYIAPGDGLGKPVFKNIPFLVGDSCLINIQDENRRFSYQGPVAEKDKALARPGNEQ